MTSDSPEMDGRRRRGQDSRDRIVSAMLAFVRGGDIPGQQGGDKGAFVGNVGGVGIKRPHSPVKARSVRMASRIQGCAAREELTVGRSTASLRRPCGAARGRGASRQGQQRSRRRQTRHCATEDLVSPDSHGAGVHLFAPSGKPAYIFG